MGVTSLRPNKEIIPSVTQTKQDGVDSKTRCLLLTFVVSNEGARGEEDWSRGKHTI